MQYDTTLSQDEISLGCNFLIARLKFMLSRAQTSKYKSYASHCSKRLRSKNLSSISRFANANYSLRNTNVNYVSLVYLVTCR